MFRQWQRYVPVASRRRQAARELATLAKQGHRADPVVIEGRTIAHTFWGRAWCDNLERYSDFSNRLPRGRTYARNGSVVDLALEPGRVEARVSGSSLYRVAIDVVALPKARWKALRKDCAGGIDSLVELLQGRFARGVMERLCHPVTGLFPAPAELRFSCSCPDWASMCKHVAASLYGVGARLDHSPELLFRLRQVDEQDLVAEAGAIALPGDLPSGDRLLADGDLAELFGLDLGPAAGEDHARRAPHRKAAARKRGHEPSAAKRALKRKASKRGGSARGPRSSAARGRGAAGKGSKSEASSARQRKSRRRR